MSKIINRTGVTRVVFVFKNFVVKVPNFTYSFENFLRGMLSNIHERNSWRYNKTYPDKLELICPIIWASWGGWVLVMKRADVEKWLHEVRLMPPIENPEDWYCQKVNNDKLYKKWIDAGFGGDDKADNYGYFENRLVKIDYA